MGVLSLLPVESTPSDSLAQSVTWPDIPQHIALIKQCLLVLEITLATFAIEMGHIDAPTQPLPEDVFILSEK